MTQPAKLRLKFKGNVQIGYGPLSVGGEVEFEYEGTPEQFRQWLEDMWDLFKDILNDIATKMRGVWEWLFGSAPPAQ